MLKESKKDNLLLEISNLSLGVFFFFFFADLLNYEPIDDSKQSKIRGLNKVRVCGL